MIPCASLLAGHRRAALPFALVAVVLLAPAPAVQAQRLLTLVSGVAEASSAGDPGPSIGPPSAAVQVDLELLRGAPIWLEVPTPDGSVLSAERSVFEDRGGGDLMWSGGQRDAGYDTVVLTVEGGRLVGRFGAAGGGVYQIHAERDGRGGMAPIVGPSLEEWCGVEAGAEDGQDVHAHVRTGAFAADPPRRVSNPQSHDRLDILVAYTAKAAENWADRGGARAAVRHAGDYLRMVFRNNRIEVVPHIVHIARASATLDRVGRYLGRHEWTNREEGLLLDLHLALDRDLEALRIEHRADMVYLFVGESPRLHGNVCGTYSLLTRYAYDLVTTDENYSYMPTGYGTNYPHWCGDYAAVFVHEIGHGLGAHHDPANLVGFLDATDPADIQAGLVRPYALGYVNYDVMPSLGTAMSYQGQIEPFFSTARIRPYGGAVLGISREQDTERMLRVTVPLVAQSDNLGLPEGGPAQPTNLRVRLKGASALLFWQDNAPDADGYDVEHQHLWDGDGWRRVYRVEGHTEAVIPLEFTVPGGRHEFRVRARKDGEYSPLSTQVVLFFPGAPIEAPSDVSVMLEPHLRDVEVRWTDNSDNETGFDAQLLRGGEPILRVRRPADSSNAYFPAEQALAQQGAEYGVKVFAFNSSGQFGSSETVAFRWEHPQAPGPVADVAASTIGPTTVRVTWTVDPEVESYGVTAKLRGWEDRRRWFPPGDGLVGTARMDFEGLARGGRYTFEVTPRRPRGLPSRAYLALGERGAGPPAPSNLSLVTEDGGLRLSWNDNSSDELGFAIQAGVLRPDSIGDRQKWWRAATVPPDTESAVFYAPLNFSDEFFVRVFAYNERGFSASSPRVSESSFEPPPRPAGPCRTDAETLCLRDSRFEVKMDWLGADGESGPGRVVDAGTDDSGLFQFFDPLNWEVLVKVLDGCGINGRMWVLGASTTDLGYRILVTDTVTGESRSYSNEPGRPAPAIVDTEAFSGACAAGAAVH